MKKRFSLILLVLCLALLVSCAGEGGAKEEVAFEPLFRFSVNEGDWNQTKVQYCSLSQGFLYLHPSEKGCTGGFVSPVRSLSSEALIRHEGGMSTVLIREKEKDRIFVLTDTKLYTVFPGDGANQTQVPEETKLQSALFYDDLSVISVRDGRILLHPLDFKETYVMASTALLPDFQGVIAVGDGGKKIWYAKGTKEGYAGIAFFEYGSNLPLGEEKFAFDSYQTLSEGGVLFTRRLEDGGALYLYRNFHTGATASVTSDVVYDGVCVNPSGSVLCGVKAKDGGGFVHCYDLQKGEKVGEHTVNYGIPAPSMALSDDGLTLLLVIGSQTDEILGTLNLSFYLEKK